MTDLLRGRHALIKATRVRIPLGSTVGFAFGHAGDEPVVVVGDRDYLRAVGESLYLRSEPISIEGEAVARGEDALERLRAWDESPREEAGLVVGYTLSGGLGRQSKPSTTPADVKPVPPSPPPEPDQMGLYFVFRELLLERDRLRREIDLVVPDERVWLIGRATGVSYAIELVGETLGILEFDSAWALRGLEGRVPERRPPFLDENS